MYIVISNVYNIPNSETEYHKFYFINTNCDLLTNHYVAYTALEEHSLWVALVALKLKRELKYLLLQNRHVYQ